MSRKSKDNWINTVIKSLKKHDEKLGEKVMEECGKQCCHDNGMLAKAKEVRNRCKGLSDDEIFEILKGELFDENARVYQEGGMFYVEYESCLCQLHDKDTKYDDFVCECTKGYTKALFETVYGKQTDVTILRTVLRGGDGCLIAVRVC